MAGRPVFWFEHELHTMSYPGVTVLIDNVQNGTACRNNEYAHYVQLLICPYSILLIVNCLIRNSFWRHFVTFVGYTVIHGHCERWYRHLIDKILCNAIAYMETLLELALDNSP